MFKELRAFKIIGNLKMILFFISVFIFIITINPTMVKANDLENNIVMLGDSLTQGCNWKNYFPNKNIYNSGAGGDTVAMVLDRVDDVLLQYKPRTIFLMVGINDLGAKAAPEVVIDGHLKIWQKIKIKSPDTELIVLSVLPVIEAKTSNRVLNKNIVYINQKLASLAQEKNLKFINLYNFMLDDNQQLKKELTSDGVHLTSKAYDIWVANIKVLIAN